MEATLRSPELLDRQRSRLVVVDMQEKLVAAMPHPGALVAAGKLLLDAARLFGVPTCAVEQYPQGLGPTVEPLRAALPDRFEKRRFSGAPALGWPAAMEAPDGRDQVLLCGVEAHVCVLQTAFDLAALGYRVSVAVDAVASRCASDRETALARLRDGGIGVTTVEAAAFEWCESADAAEFQALSALVKACSRE